MCGLLLLPLAGCAAANDDPAASEVSFSAVAGTSAPAPAAPADAVELAATGTVCGSVAGAQDDALVVIRSGSANCVRVLRAARAYTAAAAHADGQAVTLETGGWRCTATDARGPATCRAGDASFSVG
ncbi:Subtilisin inhibitor-like [Tsukamurella hominis]